MVNSDNYWILDSCGEDDSGVVEYFPDGCPENWELHENTPMLDKFPDKVELEFSEDYPEYTKLYDFVENTLNLLIISAKAKAIFDGLGIDGVEYIPASISDQNGDVLSEDYFVLNTLKTQPIIDMKKSKYVMCSLQEEMVASIKDLRINTEGVDPSAKLFRAINESNTYFITDEVIKAMEAAGITGVRTIKAEGWNGNTLSFI